MQRCHTAMISTRGAVITLASINTVAGEMTWVGVGNVTAVIVYPQSNPDSARDYLHLRGGIVGYRLPPLRTFTRPIRAGDTLIMVTDGIRKAFMQDIPIAESPEVIAQYIHVTFNRQTDDALVLVARFVASAEETGW